MLEVRQLSVKYGNKTIVDEVSFSVEEGQWLMIIGPNGAGKTTIISAISQGAPYQGEIFFEGKNIRRCKSRDLAKMFGVLTQNHYVGYGFTVEEVIRLGTYAHLKGFLFGGADGNDDRVKLAAARTGMEPYLHQSVLTLSGGELQRTFLAQLFAQAPKMLILDEPTNHLDLVYQKQVFGLVTNWIDETHGAVVSVVHDLSLAKKYGTHGILMNHGKIAAAGTIEEVTVPERLDRIYEMDVYGWMREMYGQWN